MQGALLAVGVPFAISNEAVLQNMPPSLATVRLLRVAPFRIVVVPDFAWMPPPTPTALPSIVPCRYPRLRWRKTSPARPGCEVDLDGAVAPGRRAGTEPDGVAVARAAAADRAVDQFQVRVWCMHAAAVVAAAAVADAGVAVGDAQVARWRRRAIRRRLGRVRYLAATAHMDRCGRLAVLTALRWSRSRWRRSGR